MFGLMLVFIFSLVILSSSGSTSHETGDVVFVNVLFRHGDRTPGYFYPTDPYLKQSYWPEGIAQLTNRGKMRVFELGQWLRHRYDELLTERYSPDTVYIRSTDTDRSLMSAECMLAGMFPSRGAQVWNENLPWQPIPIHTIPLNLDRVLAQRAPCPAYAKELQMVFTSDDKIKRLNESYSELLRWTSENSGDSFNLETVYKIYDTLLVESLHNMTLPEWTKHVFPEPMRQATVYNYMLETWTPKLTRLQTGLLLQEMIQNMADKAQKKASRNVHVYSAHDEMIRNILTALGAYNYILPPYAYCLMMELRADSDGNHYVLLYYRNSTTEEPYLMRVEGCGPLCPLDQFISISHPLIPEDWDQECALDDLDQKSYLTVEPMTVAAGIGATVLTVLALAALHYYCRKSPTTSKQSSCPISVFQNPYSN